MSQKLRPTALGDSSAAAEEVRARGQRLKDMNIYSHEYAVYSMRTLPDKMRTDEVYVVACGSFIFINIQGFTRSI